MRQSTSAILRHMMATAALLPEFQTAGEIERAAAELVVSAIDADEIFLTRLDLQGPDTVAVAIPDFQVQDELGAALSRVGHVHPAVISYLQPGDDRRPRRVSDVVENRVWWSSVAFNEAFRERAARYQLSLVTQLDAHLGTGWVLTRAARDFSDRDLETACLALPFLTSLTELGAAKSAHQENTCEGLTPREHAVLEMLATGRSARLIARQLGMTEATTRKHLSHIYAKLGVHDRLSAVLCLNGQRP